MSDHNEPLPGLQAVNRLELFPNDMIVRLCDRYAGKKVAAQNSQIKGGMRTAVPARRVLPGDCAHQNTDITLRMEVTSCQCARSGRGRVHVFLLILPINR